MSRSDHERGNGILSAGRRLALAVVLALTAALTIVPGSLAAQPQKAHIAALQRQAIARLNAFAHSLPDATSSAKKKCVVPKLTRLTVTKARVKLRRAGCGSPIVTKTYNSKVKAGRIFKQSPRAKKKVKGGTRVKVTVSLGKKLCVVKKRNSNGKLVTVYQTRIVKKKIRRNGKLVTVRKRVFVYRYVKHGKRRVKVKVPKMGPCKNQTSAGQSGVPVAITLVSPDSTGHVDFGAFVRDIPLTGSLKGFIVGKGFQLGKDNLIQVSGAKINLAPTGIFIDDACNGQVSDSIRTDSHSYTELDPTSTGNTIRVKPDSSVSGLLHMRIQIALDMRNDDTGCNDPYFTTGWTDFEIPLFIRGKLGATSRGLTTTVQIGETVLDDLSACLAVGDPTTPCNGFAIPFPGIFSAEIVATVKVG